MLGGSGSCSRPTELRSAISLLLFPPFFCVSPVLPGILQSFHFFRLTPPKCPKIMLRTLREEHTR